MDPLDPAIHSTAVSGVKPLLTLAIFAGLGSFFLGALVTSIRRGMKEDGWFNLNKEEKRPRLRFFKVTDLHKLINFLLLDQAANIF